MKSADGFRYVLAHALAWALLMVAALGDGIVRAAQLASAWGDGPARAAGGVAMTLLTVLAAWGARRLAAAPSIRWAMGAGLLWTAATVGFEAAVTLAAGRPLNDLWASYDPRRIAHGELILIGLAVMALAPIVVDAQARRKAQLRGDL